MQQQWKPSSSINLKEGKIFFTDTQNRLCSETSLWRPATVPPVSGLWQRGHLNRGCVRTRVIYYTVSIIHIVTCISDLQTGFGSVSRVTGHSPVVTTNNYNTLKITVIITHVKSHTKSSQADFQFFFNYELPVAMSYRKMTRQILWYFVIEPWHGPHRKHLLYCKCRCVT
jgi:hypothetical protein